MNNFGRTVLALGLGTVMTFTNPECFFQAESEPTMVYAAEKAAVQGRKLTVQSRSSISVRVSADCLGKSESTIEVTTKKEEGTKASSEKNTEGSSTERMNRRRIQYDRKYAYYVGKRYIKQYIRKRYGIGRQSDIRRKLRIKQFRIRKFYIRKQFSRKFYI